jgi:hypothetical protein
VSFFIAVQHPQSKHWQVWGGPHTTKEEARNDLPRAQNGAPLQYTIISADDFQAAEVEVLRQQQRGTITYEQEDA